MIGNNNTNNNNGNDDLMMMATSVLDKQLSNSDKQKFGNPAQQEPTLKPVIFDWSLRVPSSFSLP